MFTFIVIIHVVTCLLLLTVILMQSGRGGGLTDSFAAAESIFGTKTNSFMVRATSAMAIIFLVTCIVLAILSTQRNRSLLEAELRTRETTMVKKSLPIPPVQSAKTETKQNEVTATGAAEKTGVKQTKPVAQANQNNIVPGKNSTQAK